jgi:hypothetical protein
VQAAAVVRAQVEPQQQAPVAGMQGFGEHAVPVVKMLPAAQPAARVWVQTEAVQQAPGWGQGLGRQVRAPGVNSAVLKKQPEAERMRHRPLVRQQAPTFEHGLGSHAAPIPKNTNLDAQLSKSCIKQKPVEVSQQAPSVAVQGLGVQDVGPSEKIEGGAHAAALTMVQTSLGVQQDPTFAHGLGAQAAASKKRSSGNVQAAALETVQMPVAPLQQAPGIGTGTEIFTTNGPSLPAEPKAATRTRYIVPAIRGTLGRRERRVLTAHAAPASSLQAMGATAPLAGHEL